MKTKQLISERTWALAKRALVSSVDRGQIAFDGPHVCKGSYLERGRTKKSRCAAQSHARYCKGGRTYWYVGRISSIIPAFEILGDGETPEKALANAIRRKSQESKRWRQIEAERKEAAKR